MGNNKKNTKGDKPDYKEVRPPIETNGLSFDQLLKKVAKVNPENRKSLKESD